jgi:tRNA1(Val) A37 N6-methylase TrmN6
MPTSVQSAPARCEFRGGVEAYCNTASAMLSSSHGAARFVVCENWLNNQRVYDGAKEAELEIVTVLPVKGKESKNTPLFGVYVLRKADVDSRRNPSRNTEVLPPLAVRNQKGDWTTEYTEIMADMAIPRLPKGSHE